MNKKGQDVVNKSFFKILILFLIIGALSIFLFLFPKHKITTSNEINIPSENSLEGQFIHPEIGYKVKVPTGWKGTFTSKKTNSQFTIYSPGYSSVDTDYGADINGSSIVITTSASSVATIQKYWEKEKKDPLFEVVKNISFTKIKGVDAIQYNYDYESVSANDTVFQKDGVFYLIRIYKNGPKDYLDTYKNYLMTFEFK